MTFEDDAVNATCGKIYTPSWSKENITVDWKWFPCKETQKCIHIDNRCNLHPHPDCLYEKAKILKESVSSSHLFCISLSTSFLNSIIFKVVKDVDGGYGISGCGVFKAGIQN